MVVPAIGATTLTRRGLLLAAATTLTVSACGSGEEEERWAPSSNELVLGVSLELTGPGALVGVLQERALQITLAGLNEEGVAVGNARRKIRTVIKDNGSDPRNAEQQVTEMIDNDQVHAVLGGTIAETSLAIIEIAQDKQVPFISLAAADQIVAPLPERTFIYKVTPDAKDVARRLAGLISDADLDKVAVLAATGPYGDAGDRAMTAAIRSTGGRVVESVRLPASGATFTKAARKAAQSDPDAVVIWATPPDTGAAARAVREEGFEGRLFFDSGAVAEETLSGDNVKAVEGAHVVHPLSVGGPSLTNTSTAELARRDFVFRYIQQHGAFSGFAPYASDAVSLIANAVRLANSADRGRIRDYLETMVMEGIAGSYAFSPNSHGGMQPDSLGSFTVSQGAWTRIS